MNDIQKRASLIARLRTHRVYQPNGADYVPDICSEAADFIEHAGEGDLEAQATEIAVAWVKDRGDAALCGVARSVARFMLSLPPVIGSTPPPDRVKVLEEALDGYRAAISFIAADAWDGCGDCIEILRAARSLDTEWDWAGDPNRVALELKRVRASAALGEKQ